MRQLLLKKNTHKIFLPNFTRDTLVRSCFALTFLLLNVMVAYNIFSNHSKDNITVYLVINFVINLILLGIWYFIYILTNKLAPFIIVKGKHIKFLHWKFFDWNDNTFDLKEIDHIKIINKYNTNNNIGFTQVFYVVLKNNDCIQVHDSIAWTGKRQLSRQSSLATMLERMTGISVITEVKQFC